MAKDKKNELSEEEVKKQVEETLDQALNDSEAETAQTENAEEEVVEESAEEAEQETKKTSIFDRLTGKSGGKSGGKSNKADSAFEELKIQKAELNDKYVRLFAEFDNYKKRVAKERIEMMKTAGRDIVTDMLSVVDDFERASKAAEQSRENGVAVDLDGYTLVQNKLIHILANKGLKAMETDGADFDSEMHHAITEIPAPSDDLKGKIVDTIEKGYYMNDVIIRHAKVVVGK